MFTSSRSGKHRIDAYMRAIEALEIRQEKEAEELGGRQSEERESLHASHEREMRALKVKWGMHG